MLIKKKYYSKKFPNVNFEKLLSHYNYNPRLYDFKILLSSHGFICSNNLEGLFSILLTIPPEKAIDGITLHYIGS